MPALLGRLLLVACGAGLACVTGELCLRARLYGPAALSPAGMDSIRPIGNAGLLRPHPAWEVRFELRPNVKARFKLVEFETSNVGLRDRPYDLAKPDGVVRLAFVGDSFTMGSGVALEDTFHSRLERTLAGPDGGPVECLNFGVAGYNLVSYEGVIREKVLAYQPDMVVVCLSSNDLLPAYQTPSTPPYEVLPVTHPAWRSLLLERLFGGEPQPEPDAPPRPAPGEQATEEREPPRRGEYVQERFAALAAQARGAGAELAIVYLNFQPTDAAARASRTFRRQAEALDLPYLNTTGAFDGRDPRTLQIFPDDAHPNAEANAILARRMRPFLLRRRALGGDDGRDED